VRGRRLLCHKWKLEVVDDAVHHGTVCDESYDAHFALALGTDQGVDFINFSDHLGPAAAWDSWAFILDKQELARRPRITHLAPVGVSVEAVISDSDLALVGDMGCHPGDELQVI